MSLFFGYFVTTVSTLMILAAIGYIMYSAIRCNTVQYWGRKTALLAIFGLVLCCFVATRDGYDKSVQAFFDTTVVSGVFSFASIQSILGCIGGSVIIFASISSIFVKNQKYRKIMFFTVGMTMILKMLLIEISRLAVLV